MSVQERIIGYLMNPGYIDPLSASYSTVLKAEPIPGLFYAHSEYVKPWNATPELGQ